jgi:O-antigen/teichoic acid export membrane protein
MSTSRAVARGTTRLLAGMLSAKALDFALYLLLARRLGVETFGLFTFALSFTLLFSVLAELGLAAVFTREVARAPNRIAELLRHALMLRSGLAVATIIATVGTAWITRVPTDTIGLVAVFTLGLLLNSTAALFEGLLKSNGRAGAAGVSQVAQSAIALVAGILLLVAGLSAMAGALAYLLGAIAHCGAAVFTSRDLWRVDGPKVPFDGAAVRRERLEMLRQSALLAASGVFIAIYFRIDAVMLAAMKGDAAVGLYGGIYRLFEAFALIAVAFRSVMFPVMARAADGPAEALSVLCRKSLRVHLLFTIGVAVFFTFTAERILGLLLGPAYAAAAPGLAVLIWALPGSYMADIVLHLLTAQRRQAVGIVAVGTTAVFNIGLNLIVIPRYSFVGAAAATAASELLCFALLFAMFRRGVPRVGLVGLAWRPILAGVGFAALLALIVPRVPAGTGGTAFLALAGAVSYAALLVAFRAIGREDLRLFR